MTKIGETIEYQSFNHYIESEVGETGENLDPSHTHFLLVDDGYENKYGGEVEFRIEMVDELRNYKDKGNFTYFLCILVNLKTRILLLTMKLKQISLCEKFIPTRGGGKYRVFRV